MADVWDRPRLAGEPAVADTTRSTTLSATPLSGRVMEQAGMRREGFSPQALKKDGRLVNIVFHGVLRGEWPRAPLGRSGPDVR